LPEEKSMRAPKIPSYYKETLRKEFVVDEPREDVLDLRDKAGEGVRFPPGRDLFPGEERHAKSGKSDLLTQISDMFLEQERLERVAREWESQSQKTTQEGYQRFFRAALPLLDSFDRVIQMAAMQPPSPEMQNWLNNVASVQSRMTQLFERFGLRVMDPVGKRVNLERHEVVEVIHTDSIPDETIVEVRQKGYIFESRVLRDAQVVVAQNERR
jgi:molecular chaperone GrpE (heat shock protein)